MSKMTWTTMVIGGPVPANRRAEFEELCCDYFGHGCIEDPRQLITDAIANGKSLTLSDSVNYGNADDLEYFCRVHGLTYWKQWESVSGQFDAGIEVKRPDLDKAITETATSDNGEPALTLGQPPSSPPASRWQMSCAVSANSAIARFPRS